MSFRFWRLIQMFWGMTLKLPGLDHRSGRARYAAVGSRRATHGDRVRFSGWSQGQVAALSR